MKRGNISLVVLAIFAISFVSAYTTNVNINTFPNNEVQVYFIDNTNKTINLLDFLDLQSNSSGDLSFGYVGEKNYFNVLITVTNGERLFNYLLEINSNQEELLEEYSFSLNSSNQINEKNNNEFLFHFLRDFSENNSIVENNTEIINETNLNDMAPQKSSSLFYYILSAVLLLIILFILIKVFSKEKKTEEEFDAFNPDKPVRLYQQENLIVQSARKKLKEVSQDVAKLKDNQEKALKLKKEIIQRERELSKIKG